MERIARHLAAIAVAVTLIVVVTVSMASAAQSPKGGSGKVAPQPGVVAPAEGVRLDAAASADIQARLSSAVGAGGNLLGVSALSATPVIEDSIRYWTDGRNPLTYLDLSELTLAITEIGRLSILIDFNPPFDKLGVGTTDSLWMLLDTDNNVETGTDFGGLIGFDNIVVFENASGWRANVYRTPAGIPWTIETSWTVTVAGNSVSAEIPLSSLHNSKELVFLLASIDDSSGVVDLIPDSSFGVYEIDPAWLTPVTTTTTIATTTTTLPTTTTTLATTTTTAPPSTTTTTVPPASFTDVPPSHPYFLQINDMASRHVVDGYGGGLFGPQDYVLRQQFAKMVVNRDGLSGERGEHLPVHRRGPAPGQPLPGQLHFGGGCARDHRRSSSRAVRSVERHQQGPADHHGRAGRGAGGSACLVYASVRRLLGHALPVGP